MVDGTQKLAPLDKYRFSEKFDYQIICGDDLDKYYAQVSTQIQQNQIMLD